MAQFNLIIIKDDKLYITKTNSHFLTAMINKRFRFIDKLLNIIRTRYYLDCGYYLLDFDNRLILSNQISFSSSNLSEQGKNVLDDFDFREIY